MPIDPSKVVIQNDGGDANMGSLAFGQADSQAHFWLTEGGVDQSFVVVFIRIHFNSGTGAADVAVNVDSDRDSSYDTLLYTLNDRGTGADANFRVLEDELMHWVFQAGDRLVLTWTNPDSGTMVWGAEVGLIKVSDLATS